MFLSVEVVSLSDPTNKREVGWLCDKRNKLFYLVSDLLIYNQIILVESQSAVIFTNFKHLSSTMAQKIGNAAVASYQPPSSIMAPPTKSTHLPVFCSGIPRTNRFRYLGDFTRLFQRRR